MAEFFTQAIAVVKQLLEAFGWPGTILVLVSLGVVRASKFLAAKLFDDEPDPRTGAPRGYLPRIVNSHLEFVASVKDSVGSIKTAVESQGAAGAALSQIAKMTHDEVSGLRRMLLAGPWKLAALEEEMRAREQDDDPTREPGRETIIGPAGFGKLS